MEYNVIDLIPFGTDNPPISREELVRLTGLCDRAVRREINYLKKVYPIVNIGKGYYIPDNPDDPGLEEYIRKEMHRIQEISRGLRRHKALWKTNTKQEVMF